MAKKNDSKITPAVPAPAKRAAKPAAAKTAKTAPAKAKAAAKTTKPKAPSAPKAPKAPAAAAYTRDDIALRAYFIAENRRAAGVHGDEHQDWVEAERQLASEAKRPKKAAKA